MSLDPMEARLAAKSTPGDFAADVVAGTVPDLIETCEDGRRGFETAADRVELESTAMQLRKFAAERGTMAGELMDVGAPYGVQADSGSSAAALHRGWMNLEAALTSGDHAILASAEQGEDHALEVYDSAVETSLPSEVAELVARQRAAIERAHDAVRALRDAAA